MSSFLMILPSPSVYMEILKDGDVETVISYIRMIKKQMQVLKLNTLVKPN